VVNFALTSPADNMLTMTNPTRKTVIILSIVLGLIVVQLMFIGLIFSRIARRNGGHPFQSPRPNSQRYAGNPAQPGRSKTPPNRQPPVKTAPKPKPTGPRAAPPKFT